jgi:FtsP/CotA-like multicopper oxidase with cupredoxin domain
MRGKHGYKGIGALLLIVLLAAGPAAAEVRTQCPPDTNGDGISDDPSAVCKHLAAGDGFIKMADGKPLYIFSFSDATGVNDEEVMERGMLAAEFPAPTISVKEGQKVYLTLSNVGMMMRPDLFDPHSVHWHGFPNASTVFDGEPMASISINMGASLTYFYVAPDPGTYMYHCHVEATEHMQMGMLGNLYVTPKQNDLPDGTSLSGFVHHTGYKYVYNDGDGSTYYDVEYPVQISAMDSNFHEKHIAVQPLPFAMMKDNYPMLNGRGYPDTIDPAELGDMAENNFIKSQKMNSIITATRGQKILLRISSLSTTEFFTLGVLGIPMKVVGRDAKILRSQAGQNLSYATNSVTLGGGQSADVVLDTAAVQPGTYYLYTTNMAHLNNGPEANGGMMTEIVIN